MADEAVGGAESPAPEAPSVPTDENSAVDFIGEAVGRQARGEPPPAADSEQTTRPESPEVQRTEEPEPEFEGAEPEPQEEAEPDDEPVENEPEPEPEPEPEEDPEPEEVEVPDTLEALADHFGVDIADLAGHLTFALEGDNGEVTHMSLAEAMRGTLRESDYTFKTEKLADERREFDAVRETTTQALAQKHQTADALIDLLNQEVTQGPTDQELLTILDPNSPNYAGADAAAIYAREKAMRDNRMQLLNQALATKEDAIKQAQAESEHKFAEWRTREESGFKRLFPSETSSEKGLSEFEGKIRDYLTKGIRPEARFTPDEVNDFMRTYDHRFLAVLSDAVAHTQGKKATKEITKKLKAKPKTVKPAPGPQRQSANASARSKAEQRLLRGGGKDAAVDFIRASLQRQR